jgi:Kef-type K+ transport system membrane component KefB
MLATLSLLLVVTAAYLLAHFVVDRLQHRYFFTTGGEYLLLGVLVGPANPSFTALTDDVLRQLAPLVSLAIGWMGLLYGSRLDMPRLKGGNFTAGRIALIEALVTGGIVAITCSIVLYNLPFDWPNSESYWLAISVLAVSATVASPAALTLVKDRLGAKGQFTELLDRVLRFNELIAILAFGAILCIFHRDNPALGGRPTDIEWFVLSLALGAALGVLFFLFIGDEHDEDKQFLALVGIIVFASGLAHSLELSPLLVNLILGFALVSLADKQLSEEITRALERTARPMYILLLIFAGAMAPIGGMTPWLLAMVYVASRVVAKMVGGWVASIGLGHRTRWDQGRGLIGHGEIAVAMALNLMLVFPGELGQVVSVAILSSVLANEIWSARLLKGLLIDAGDIRHTASDDSHPSPPGPVPLKPHGA